MNKEIKLTKESSVEEIVTTAADLLEAKGVPCIVIAEQGENGGFMGVRGTEKDILCMSFHVQTTLIEATIKDNRIKREEMEGDSNAKY